MATSSTDLEFRVVGLSEGGLDRVTVNFAQVTEPGTQPAPYVSTFNLNLPLSEAKGYFPGQTYKVSLTPTK